MPLIRLNVNESDFPLISYYSGPGVMQRTPGDNDYIVTNSYTGTLADSDIGIPRPAYMHNVLPSAYGRQSVSYQLQHSPESSKDSVKKFRQIVLLRTSSESRHYYASAANSKYILHGNVWNRYPSAPLSGYITSAYINGRTFVHHQYGEISEYSDLTKTMAPISLNGLNSPQLLGITSSRGMLIGYDSTHLYFSSFSDPTDFIPSLSTSAQGFKLQAARGAIKACLPIAEGFIVYTTHNAVAALWTGDTPIPFTFREIPGSAGVLTPEHVSFEANVNSHFAWTTSGLQQVSVQGASHVFPQVSDFLAGREVEQLLSSSSPRSLGESAELTIQKALSTCFPPKPDPFSPFVLQTDCYDVPLRVKLSFIGTRFLCISYGTPIELNYVLVYDLALRRWGKLKITHVDLFEYSPPGYNAPEPLNSIGILQKDGTIYTVSHSHCDTNTDSALIYGSIRHIRGQVKTVKEVRIAHNPEAEFKTFFISQIESRDWASITQANHPYTATSLATTFKPNLKCEAFSLALTGTFGISALEIDFG